MKKRGQGAMEYLMTYGWAILVVMVVGIVMWQLGIFNIGGITSTTAQGFPRIKPQLALTSLDQSGVFQAVFTNGAGGPISITAFNLTSSQCTADVVVPASQLASLGIIGAGDNFNVSATGTCLTANGGAGDPYNVDITIEYNVTLATQVVEHTEHGSIRGPLE